MIKVVSTEIEDVKIIEPKIFHDNRGYFFESYNQLEFHKAIGKINFVQDNESKSSSYPCCFSNISIKDTDVLAALLCICCVFVLFVYVNINSYIGFQIKYYILKFIYKIMHIGFVIESLIYIYIYIYIL